MLTATEFNLYTVSGILSGAGETAAPALAMIQAGTAKWPAKVATALEIPDLNWQCAAVVANIAVELAAGRSIPRDWLASLAHRVARYHDASL